MTEDYNLKNFVTSLTKFLAYQDELKLIPPVEDSDNAAYLMRVLGIDKGNVNVLIGGSNCPIFHKAAAAIEGLKGALMRTEEQLRNARAANALLRRRASHSIHCAGYRGGQYGFDDSKCDCKQDTK